MQKKVIRLTESELRKMIENIIEEQTLGSTFTQAQIPAFNVGQQARKAVNQAAINAVKGLKETAIVIGKVTFTVVAIGGFMLFLVGAAVYKVTQVVGNAIIKLISATGRAVVKGATALGNLTIQAFNKAGLALEKGMDYVGQKLSALKDTSIGIAKWVIEQFKQFGTQVWAKILVAASGVKEFGSMLANYLKNSWATIQNQIGVAWEQASSWAKNAYNSAVQGVKNTASKIGSAVSNTANNLAQSAASAAGKTWGAIKGFLSEMYSRYVSFSDDTTSILSEAVALNGKVIL